MLDFYGTEYGGFYVESDVMYTANNIVYSFGIGEDLSFSEAIMKNYNCEIYAFDPTPKAIKYVKQHGLYNNKKFHFFEIGVSDFDGKAEFHLPVNDDFVSGSFHQYGGVKDETITVKVMTFHSILEMLGHDRINILKMDIEGSEFSVISGMRDGDFIFDQLCIEFHSRFFDDGKSKQNKALEILGKEKYSAVAQSKETEEYTFIKEGYCRRDK